MLHLEHHRAIVVAGTHHSMNLSFALPLSRPLRFKQATKTTSHHRPRFVRFPSCVSSAAFPGRSQNEASSTSSNVNSPPPPNPGSTVWETINGCQVVIPATDRPVAIVRFTGGLGAGVAPRALYGTFLEEIARRGNVAVIGVPINASFDHKQLALETAKVLGKTTQELMSRWDVPWIPVFGMGHSLGAKIQLLISCFQEARRDQGPSVANILIAFNNFTAAQSIPMWDKMRNSWLSGTERSAQELEKVSRFLKDLDFSRFSPLDNEKNTAAVDTAAQVLRNIGKTIEGLSAGMSSGEFTPTPTETIELASSKYSVSENILISFTRDTLDQADALQQVLLDRFGARGAVTRKLSGTHVTPMTPPIAGRNKADGFASVGSESIDEELRKAASSVNAELDNAVAVVVAYLRLHLEILASTNLLP